LPGSVYPAQPCAIIVYPRITTGFPEQGTPVITLTGFIQAILL